MKKILAIILCLTMIFANTVFAMESTDTKSDEIVKDDKLLKEYIQLGKNFLNQYYSSIAEKKAFDKLSYIHKNELKEYVKLKHLIMKERLINSDLTVEKSEIETIYSEHRVKDDEIEIIFNVLLKNKYSGFSELSESMKQVKLNFSEGANGLEIVDYFELDFFDRNINQIHKNNKQIIELAQSNNDLDKMSFDEDLLQILNQQLLDERQFYKNIQNNTYEDTSISNKDTEIDNAYTSTKSWNRNAIKSYATSNANKDTPSSGNSSQASYYDFSEISGAYDCTNFVSHCLLAGGANENRSNWYYDSLSNRTPSWSGVNFFYDFITTNSGTGPQGEEIGFNYNCPYQNVNWKNGDIVQIQYASYGQPGFGHSTIITGEYCTGGYPLYSPTITYRSSDYSYGINVPLIFEYPLSSSNNVAYRLIRLTSIGY